VNDLIEARHLAGFGDPIPPMGEEAHPSFRAIAATVMKVSHVRAQVGPMVT